jgi:putative membrane protein
MHRHGSGMVLGTGGWVVMVIGMVLFWTVAAILVIALIRHLNRNPHHYGHDHGHDSAQGRPASWQSAEQTLAERFARGEIDEDEYQRRLTTLRESR